MEREATKSDSAVLFVHGIGWQRPGQTLQSFVNPIRQMLQQLTASSDSESPEVHVTWATLKEAENPSLSKQERLAAWLGQEVRFWRRPVRGEPPLCPMHTECEIVQSVTHSTERRQKWLLAESCWARSFPNPTGIELACWAIKIAPWFALFHTGATSLPIFLRWRATVPKANALTMKDIIRFLPATLIFYVRLLVNALLVVLTSVVAIPIIILTSFVPVLRWVGLAAIGLVGDSYAAIVHPSSLKKMIETVQRDIQWCLKRSPRLVIVGHSQGAMLAREALSRMQLGNRVVLIGLGSGITILQSLQQAERRQIARFGWLGLFSVCIAVVVSLAFPAISLFETFRNLLRIISEMWHSIGGLSNAILDPQNFGDPVAEAVRLSLEIIRAMQSSNLLDVGHLFVPMLIWAAVLTAAYFIVKQLGFEMLPDRVLHLLTFKSKQVHRWIEFASWHDPVTCGAFLKASRAYSRKSRKGLAVEVRMVTNGSLLPFEHRSYRHNPLVLLRILREINQASRRPIAALNGASVDVMRRAALSAQRSNRSRLRLQLAALEIAIASLVGGALWIAWS